jgi:hypothetical protein
VSAAPNTMAAPKLVKQTRFFMAENSRLGWLQNSTGNCDQSLRVRHHTDPAIVKR